MVKVIGTILAFLICRDLSPTGRDLPSLFSLWRRSGW